MPKKLFVLLSILFISFTSTNAQTVFGKYAGEFMAIGIGGRPLGMGGAFVAVANDVTAGYYNPAGLANLNYPQVSLMHSEQFGNLVNYDYAAVGIPFGTDMSFGISVMRLGVDGIPGPHIGYVYLPAFLGIIATSMLMAPFGAKLAHSLPVDKLKRIFAILLFVVGTKMLWSAFM